MYDLRLLVGGLRGWMGGSADQVRLDIKGDTNALNDYTRQESRRNMYI